MTTTDRWRLEDARFAGTWIAPSNQKVIIALAGLRYDDAPTG